VKYEISGITVKSNIEFPELTRSKGKKSNLIFTFSSEKFINNNDLNWFSNLTLPNGMTWLSVARIKTSYVLSFPDIAYFVIDNLNDHILCYPASNIPFNAVRYLFINQVIPLYLSTKGKIVLHSSAVSINGNAVVFTGLSATGKSTLASVFCREGHKLITDDYLLINKYDNQFYAVPSYAGIKLSDISKSCIFKSNNIPTYKNTLFTEKQWIDINKSNMCLASEKVKISRIYLLQDLNSDRVDIDVTISRTSVKESFTNLIDSMFLLDFNDLDMVKKNFNNCADLLNSNLIKKLEYKRSFKILDNLIETIIKDVK
jgi:hypothetical protein